MPDTTANRTHRLSLVVALEMILCLGLPAQLPAVGRSSARAVALSEAFTGLAVGTEAARFNPANLGLSSHRQNSLELVGVGVSVANNAFTLDDYNSYSGAFLTDADKRAILNDVPNDGLNLAADVEASVLALSHGSFAFVTSGVGQADISLNKELIDLILNGNSLADSVSLDGSRLDGVAYISAGLSYGRSVYISGTRELAIGITAKYIRGIAMERLVEAQGLAATFESGFQGNGRLVVQTATGGSGFAFDLGAALRLNDRYTAGIRIKNLLSSIAWSSGTEEHGFLFSFDTLTVVNMDDDYVVADDYSREISGFSTSLPSVVNLGLARTIGTVLWAVDIEQGFKQAAGSSTNPRIAAGAEWWLSGYLPLRGGFATGGTGNTNLSFGSGLRLERCYFDMAVVTGTTPSFYSSKGLNVALSTGIYF